MSNSSVIEGLILCGGKAERMGGRDKGLIPLKDQALVSWVAKTLNPQVTKLRVNANRCLDEYQALGFEVLTDSVSGFAGPLAGFQVGLEHCSSPYLLVVPCDSPLLPKNLAEKLFTALTTHHLDVSYAATPKPGDPKGIQTHPVFCLMKKEVLPSLNHFLASGERKIDRWFKELKHQAVLFEDESAFANVNTPDELLQLAKLIE